MITTLELIPISTLLTLVVNQVLEVAVAAQDVLVEKETFNKLSRYLHDIEPVLKELKDRCFRDLTAANKALQSLKNDLDRAHELIKSCQGKSKFYLLLRCKTIVNDAQQVTREIGRDLELLSLAGTELSLDVRDNLHRLRNQLLSAEYQACKTRLEVVERLEAGIREYRTDQGFANDLLIAIANAVGVEVQPSEISKELSSFRKEKEHLASQKKLQEGAFMEQVLLLLSRADAASASEIAIRRYSAKSSHFNDDDDVMEPLDSFICPLKQDVMEDPVFASSNMTYERKEIEKWFSEGNKLDPVTQVELQDFTLRPNNALKKTIQEWTERNYCIRIRKAKLRLQEAEDENRALDELCQLCTENSINKDWIGADNVIPLVVGALGIHDKETQAKALTLLLMLVQGNPKNRDEVVHIGGLGMIVRCLGKRSLGRIAASLVLELLHDSEEVVADKLCQEKSAILYLVMLQNDNDVAARVILQRLCNKDENIVQMASMSYLEPLTARLLEGGDESKLKMALALGKMESLSVENKQMLADKGVIPPLINMVLASNVETQVAALGALKNLSTTPSNQDKVVRAGGFDAVLNQLTGSRLPQVSKVCAAAILKNLSTSSELLGGLDTERAVPRLMELLLSAHSITMRADVLQILLGMASSSDGTRVRRLIKEQDGIPFLVRLLDDMEKDVRESALNLLRCLSEQEARPVADAFINDDKLGLLINLLDRSRTTNVRAAAAQILASFPDNKPIKASLMTAVPVLLSAITAGGLVTEKVLAAIQRFTDPSDVQSQAELAEWDIHSTLVNVLQVGTPESKYWAALALGNLSTSTHELSQPAAVAPSSCFCFRRTGSSVCRAHQGVCTVKSTFCIVEAKAVPPLVQLLDEPGSRAAEAGVRALSTLVANRETAEKAALFLHEQNAIDRIIPLLSKGTQASKTQAIDFLEQIFRFRKLKELYASKAKLPLVNSATTSGSIKPKAARVLAQLGVLQADSSSLLSI